MSSIYYRFASTPFFFLFHLRRGLIATDMLGSWRSGTKIDSTRNTPRTCAPRRALGACGNLQLIPVHLRLARSLPSCWRGFAPAHVRDAPTRRRQRASQGSLNNCNLRRGMRDVASSRKQVSRPFPRRMAIPHRPRARGPCVRARALFDAISRMPEDGDAAVRRASYSRASSAGSTHLGTL